MSAHTGPHCDPVDTGKLGRKSPTEEKLMPLAVDEPTLAAPPKKKKSKSLFSKKKRTAYDDQKH